MARFMNAFEETVIAILLGAMCMITFANVVLRYGFESSLLWGLEVVTVLFAWLVLFGISYGVKVTAHLGVDAITNMVPHRAKRIMLYITCVGELRKPAKNDRPLVPHRFARNAAARLSGLQADRSNPDDRMAARAT